jgi:hypothetical protein
MLGLKQFCSSRAQLITIQYSKLHGTWHISSEQHKPRQRLMALRSATVWIVDNNHHVAGKDMCVGHVQHLNRIRC